MSIYPEIIDHLLQTGTHCRAMPQTDASGAAASFQCGCFVRFELQVSQGPTAVEQCSFRTNGCGFMAAAAEVVAGEIEGGPLTDLHCSDNLYRIGERPPFAERSGCAGVVADALRAALADLRQRRLDEYSGDEALVCTCFSVSESTIVSAIEDAHAETVADVMRICRAGAGCGSCHLVIEELLDASGRMQM